jgi:hypothetical protein
MDKKHRMPLIDGRLPKLYFGHPINVYNTDLEKELLQKILIEFAGWVLENPNQPHHDQAYMDRKKAGQNPMDYFFDEILPSCDGGVFMPFRDGKFGAGVAGEAKALAARGCSVWKIDHLGNLSQWDPNDESTVLSVDETRARVRGPSGFLPY